MTTTLALPMTTFSRERWSYIEHVGTDCLITRYDLHYDKRYFTTFTSEQALLDFINFTMVKPCQH